MMGFASLYPSYEASRLGNERRRHRSRRQWDELGLMLLMVLSLHHRNQPKNNRKGNQQPGHEIQTGFDNVLVHQRGLTIAMPAG
ncbi:hypothetical protein JQ628_11635 [Bradyrhizobium lablabi]|uniref:hypothetical protein n=1 Tax=Bradyrhizobium lablabi TaxID=722472 RepID=UPI001BAA660A|nr:hypothetical protein [Bradyrhizobium lablabi]MBR1122167.1 hypothetical protein [Bradyrhizobium lablabi]